MSDDLGKKVQQIAQLLGQEDVPDNVKELVSLIAASLDNKGSKGDVSSEAEAESTSNASSEKVTSDGDISPETLPPGTGSPVQGNTIQNAARPGSEGKGAVLNKDMLDTAKSALSRFNASSDPRINLLNAIKPFMNNKRQKKIGNCIQLLQIAGFSRLINDQEK